MPERLYIVIDRNAEGPDVLPFRTCMGDPVHPVALRAEHHIWSFTGLVDERYVDGIYIPDGRLARQVHGYQMYMRTPTGYADTLWYDRETGVPRGCDSAYDAMCDMLVPATLGKKDVMAAVLGTGRMASAAVAALYPVCLYLNVVTRGNSPTEDDIDTVVGHIAGENGKPTCAVEYVGYGTAALGAMDIVVNATPVPLGTLVPGFTPAEGQYVLDLAEDRGNAFRAARYCKVISRWTEPTTPEYLGYMEKLRNLFNG
jgi:hypothetical protein